MLAGLYAQLLHKILEKHSDLSDRETITESLLIVLCPYNSLEIHELVRITMEPTHEKTNNLGFRLDSTQTNLYNHRSRLEA